MRPELRRWIAFGLVCIIIVAVVAVFGSRALRRSGANPAKAVAYGTPDQIVSQSAAGAVAFRSTALGPAFGSVGFSSPPSAPPTFTEIKCERVYSAGNVGIALQATRRAFATYKAVLFDSSGRVVHTYPLQGIPSRARLSPDGRYAASTVFVSGDSYASSSFSTRTIIYDLSTTNIMFDLETFTVEKEAKAFKRVDFNYWGVTFSKNSDLFYATLATGGIHYLVKGSVSNRTIKVLREGIECPSLSPDEKFIAFKSRKRDGLRIKWSIMILDLQNGTTVEVNETRSVDDQVEWLDSSHILYALPRNEAGSASSDVWVATMSGHTQPEVFIENASSPSVIRHPDPTSRKQLTVL